MKFLVFVLFSVIGFSNSLSYGQSSHEPLPCLNKTFGMIVHMVRDSSGGTTLTETDVEDLIDQLNNLYDSICVNFEVCEFRYINNYQYDSVEINAGEFQQMQIDYNEANRINMYFVTHTSDMASFGTPNGISMMNSGGLLILKGVSIMFLAHEMGHYFNLRNTYHGSQSGNPELADGSNCATAGDLLCDTPADPFYSGYNFPWFNVITGAYDFSGVDANGQFYTPLTQNIMSVYETRCFFTFGQYRRMAQAYLSSNPKMW
ncbi:MAG: hypothetical protein AB8B74_07395 [Crocinitomicaceae bacterium]